MFVFSLNKTHFSLVYGGKYSIFYLIVHESFIIYSESFIIYSESAFAIVVWKDLANFYIFLISIYNICFIMTCPSIYHMIMSANNIDSYSGHVIMMGTNQIIFLCLVLFINRYISFSFWLSFLIIITFNFYNLNHSIIFINVNFIFV